MINGLQIVPFVWKKLEIALVLLQTARKESRNGADFKQISAVNHCREGAHAG